MLSLKQIGTICFLTIFFISPTFADNEPTTPTLIPASEPGCNQAVLNTTSGSASLEAIYTPNTITTQWYTGYGENGVYSSPTTCRYNDTINLPATNPSRPGYAFNGWTLRVPPFDLTTLDPTVHATSYAYNNINGFSYASTGASATGLNNGEWILNFSYGTIHGRAYCSSRAGGRYGADGDPIWPVGYSSNGVATEAQVMVGTGSHCWCNVTGYTPVNGTTQNVATEDRWVAYNMDDEALSACDGFFDSDEDEYENCLTEHCPGFCSSSCIDTVISSSVNSIHNIWLALLGIRQ